MPGLEALKLLELKEAAEKCFPTVILSPSLSSGAQRRIALCEFSWQYEILPSFHTGPPAAPQNDNVVMFFNKLLAEDSPGDAGQRSRPRTEAGRRRYPGRELRKWGNAGSPG